MAIGRASRGISRDSNTVDAEANDSEDTLVFCLSIPYYCLPNCNDLVASFSLFEFAFTKFLSRCTDYSACARLRAPRAIHRPIII